MIKMVATYDTRLLTSNFIPLIYVCKALHTRLGEEAQRNKLKDIIFAHCHARVKEKLK